MIPPVIKIETTIAGIRKALEPRRSLGLLGFVPTMGALHAGHARLIEVARENSATVVVSIFVNPLQFDDPKDYDRYQRNLDADVELAAKHGADLVFAPCAAEMYPETAQTFVEVQGLTDHFCGAARPGHFRGVTTVVSKLFHIVQPDLASFGEKDAQQLAVIQTMVLDLNFPLKVVPVPTVREPDGLAMSSRNSRLNEEERVTAVCLYEALTRARELILAGEPDSRQILAQARAILNQPGVEVEYFDLADPKTMRPVTSATPPVRVMGAIRIGATRLIDNLSCP
jgi:pantoate--beta-alanine ligase